MTHTILCASSFSILISEEAGKAEVLIIGAGFAGQTAALYLGSALGKNHEITLANRS